MEIKTPYKDLPDDVKSAIAELNALVNVTGACLDPKFKNSFLKLPTIMAFDRVKKMSLITQQLMCD
jgi:hypothetical protein